MTVKISEMRPTECYHFLESTRFGHIACCREGSPYIAAIYFAFSGNVAYSFSMPGKKLDWMRANNKVCLHAEQLVPGGWTSVVADGHFEEFPDNDTWKSERLHAWSLLKMHPDWWEIGSMKPYELPMLHQSPHVFYGVTVTSVSGRIAVTID